MKGDLHVHTTLSDGSLGMEEVIAQAKRIGLDFISITDHDTMSSVSRAKVLGERYGVQTIPGVELTAWDKTRNRKVHILCYAPQKPDRLEGICRRCSEIRQSCAKETVENVLKLFPITAEDITKHLSGSKSIYKQHILHALIEYGYSTHFYGKLNDELFNEETGSCIVEREYPDVNYVLELIHSARGAAVLAHPMVYDSVELIDDLASNGKLDGIEVYHYSADEEQQAMLLAKANEYDLIVTGGSDFHGLYNMRPTHLGMYTTDKENIDRILRLCSKK
ncbi:MAG: PHP domain-containing protein [Oscillospiraceae bacterium]|nr:PHP domain-containing protein [Oscillospiraceae bacterium]MCI7499943.1 PHP domain-containing protein [Oscillospiraceae bacterium]MDD7279081.1 PHP domain-containing protein [Oscillospiraceae bacterium]MDY2863723.1 PHP domain-containing protein [Oscillospiraceae bacterium]